jgi:hypothetical protein
MQAINIEIMQAINIEIMQKKTKISIAVQRVVTTAVFSKIAIIVAVSD